MKNRPWVAAILNLFLPGSGYLYIGKRKFLGVGLLLFSLAVYYSIIFGTASSSSQSNSPSDIVAGIAFIITLLSLSYDAYYESFMANKEQQASSQ